ncbi:MAG: ADP-ribosylglycohydrolase family protein [Bacteroidia bacterium]
MTLDNRMLEDLILGLSVGDAFGAGVEFQDRDWIRANVNFSSFVNARHLIQVPDKQLLAFTQDYQDWDYTDDTEMTLGVLRALRSGEEFTEDSVVLHVQAEYLDGVHRKGFGRNGHGSLRWFFDGKMSIDQIRDFQCTRPNPGNAPAVRATPIGLLVAEHQINAFAAINARATHPHPHAIMASQCVAWATHLLLIQEMPLSEVIEACMERAELDAPFRDYLAEVDALPDFESLTESDFETLCGPQPIQEPYFLPGIKGMPSDSLYSAGAILYVLKHSADAFDALRKSVLLGGDVDSIAAVTTGILAARCGVGSLPRWMFDRVEKVICWG